MARQITTPDQLETLYGPPLQRSLDKETDYLTDQYRAFVTAAPFVILASVGPDGTDCSPRGDPPGFVRVIDSRTLRLPDRRGNNRIDTLRNLVHDPRISLLFMIPGVGETLRINGQAALLTGDDICGPFAVRGKKPACVIEVHVEQVYYQCQKALARSRLWDPETRLNRAALPSAGEMLQALSREPFDGNRYDADYPEHMKKTIY